MEMTRQGGNKNINSLDDILVSYDRQTGSYIKSYYDDKKYEFLIDKEKKYVIAKEYLEERGKSIAKVIDELNINTFLEVGCGEATSIYLINKNLNRKHKIFGLDISSSRVHYGNLFLKNEGICDIDLCVGNMFALPFMDNSLDAVITIHAIEPNTGRESEALKELYRVANRYVILIEPSHKFGNEETRANIEKHKYCKNLEDTIDDLGYNVIFQEIFPHNKETNIAVITIIKKRDVEEKIENVSFSCPICLSTLDKKDHVFCEECDVVYPKIKDIGIYTKDKAIFFSKYLDDNLQLN